MRVKLVYALAAPWATHFVRRCASLQEAADAVGRSAGSIKSALYQSYLLASFLV